MAARSCFGISHWVTKSYIAKSTRRILPSLHSKRIPLLWFLIFDRGNIFILFFSSEKIMHKQGRCHGFLVRSSSYRWRSCMALHIPVFTPGSWQCHPCSQTYQLLESPIVSQWIWAAKTRHILQGNHVVYLQGKKGMMDVLQGACVLLTLACLFLLLCFYYVLMTYLNSGNK